jgi:hypothetical protein
MSITETLSETIHREPFQPFVIHLVGGGTIDVWSRDSIAHPPGSRTVAVVQKKKGSRIIDVSQVARIEVS